MKIDSPAVDLAIAAIACLALVLAIFTGDFRTGLALYADPAERNSCLARIRVSAAKGDGTPGKTAAPAVMSLAAVPGTVTLPAPGQGRRERLRTAPGPVLDLPLGTADKLTLSFDRLSPGPLGTLLGLEKTVYKLGRIRLAAGGRTLLSCPLNGGKDLCFQFLELAGSPGTLFGTPERIDCVVRVDRDGTTELRVEEGKIRTVREPGLH